MCVPSGTRRPRATAREFSPGPKSRLSRRSVDDVNMQPPGCSRASHVFGRQCIRGLARWALGRRAHCYVRRKRARWKRCELRDGDKRPHMQKTGVVHTADSVDAVTGIHHKQIVAVLVDEFSDLTWGVESTGFYLRPGAGAGGSGLCRLRDSRQRDQTSSSPRDTIRQVGPDRRQGHRGGGAA